MEENEEGVKTDETEGKQQAEKANILVEEEANLDTAWLFIL